MYLNYGVVLKSVAAIDVCTDTWYQTFLITLPSVNQSALNIDSIECSMVGNADECERILPLVRYLHNISRNAVLEINRTLQHIRLIIREIQPTHDDERSNERLTRGLLDFVGEISHSLFGTARDGDVDNVKQMLQHFKKRQDTGFAAWQQTEARLASFGDAVNHRLDTINDMIATEKQAIHTLFEDVMRQSSQEAQIASILALSLRRLEDFVILRNHLSEFQTGLEMLASGLLSPALIPPRDIFQALRAIEDIIRTVHTSEGMNLRILRHKVGHYYRMHDFMTIRQYDNILIQLPVRLGILPVHLNLYEVHVTPMITPGSEKHITILDQVPKYLAYNPQSEYFLEMDKIPEISSSNLIFLEHTHEILKSSEQQSCLLAIIHNNKSQIAHLCKYTVVTNAVTSDIFVLDRRHVLLTQVSNATVNCRGRLSHNITCAATCRIALSCGCSLVTDTAFIPPRLEGCIPSFDKVRPVHSVNLAFLSQFFKESELSEFHANTLLPDPLKVVVPQLKIFEADYSHQLQADKSARFDLKHLTNLTKQDMEAYASLAHSMVPQWLELGNFDNNFNLLSWKTWLSISTSILAILGFSLAVRLSYKVRILSVALTTVNTASRTHALPTQLIYFPQTASPPNVTSNVLFLDFPTDWTLDLSVIFLLVLIFLAIVVKNVKSYRKSRYEYDLYLHVGLETEACEIWIKKFQLEPSSYSFTATDYLESLEVAGIWSPKLLLIWPTLVIQSEVTAETYSLPRMMNLSWSQARTLRKMLQKSYWSVLVAKTHAGQSVLTLPRREWRAAPPYGGLNEGLSMATLQTTAASAPVLYPALPNEAETKL